MRIRKARKEDINAIIGLQIDLIKHLQKVNPERYAVSGLGKREFKEKLLKWLKDKKTIIYVAEENNKVVGFSVGKIRKYPGFVRYKLYGDLFEISVSPEHRHKGIGTKLANTTIDFFRKKGIRIVEGLVENKNKTAREAWKKIGFKDELTIIVKRLK